MRSWQLFVRNLKETYRDLLALGFLLAFPLLFMVVFGSALSGNSTPSYNIAVIDNDQSPVSASFISDALSNIPTFDISLPANSDDALKSLKLGDLRAYMVIPKGFGDAVTKNWVATGAEIKPEIKLNITYDESDLAISSEIVSTVNVVVRSFAKIEIPVSVNADPINISHKPKQIDFLAPGIIVFGLLIMIPTAARIMVRDKEKGYLARLLTTPTRPWEFTLGYTLCMTLVAIAQIVFFIIFAQLYGVHITGSIGLAFLVFLLTAISSIGIGMMVASLSKSENQAEPLTWLFTMPLAVLSGVWFSISYMPKYIQTIANIFPYAHAVSSAREILIRGANIAAVQNDLLFLAAWAVGATILGIIFFARTMRS
jgi:ABC-2 type transport system permease protein